jgi:hypothetical protein
MSTDHLLMKQQERSATARRLVEPTADELLDAAAEVVHRSVLEDVAPLSPHDRYRQHPVLLPIIEVEVSCVDVNVRQVVANFGDDKYAVFAADNVVVHRHGEQHRADCHSQEETSRPSQSSPPCSYKLSPSILTSGLK